MLTASIMDQYVTSESEKYIIGLNDDEVAFEADGIACTTGIIELHIDHRTNQSEIYPVVPGEEFSDVCLFRINNDRLHETRSITASVLMQYFNTNRVYLESLIDE